jgi:Fe-S-cluster containining protein
VRDISALVSPHPPDCPSVGRQDAFPFRCGKDLACFTSCCRDVSIVLTPYDVLRMKHALKMDSSEFLQRYTIVANTRQRQFPLVLIRMDEQTKACPFVGAEGCSIYGHRPWACRMYPLGFAEPQQPAAGSKGFYFVLREELCQGHKETGQHTVEAWLAAQGLDEYEMMEESFAKLHLGSAAASGEPLDPNLIAMYFIACYDLDRFRQFVFSTTFLKRFEVEAARVEAVLNDDEELLNLAMDWLRFVLLHERTLKFVQPSLPRPKCTARPAGGLSA